MKTSVLLTLCYVLTMSFTSCDSSIIKNNDNASIVYDEILKDLSGTVWKGYYADEDISIMNNADRKDYENDGGDGMELHFIGKNIVKFLDGHYDNGKFFADDGVYTYEYTYKAPNGSAINKGSGDLDDFTFVIDDNVMIVYYPYNSEMNTWTLIRIK